MKEGVRVCVIPALIFLPPFLSVRKAWNAKQGTWKTLSSFQSAQNVLYATNPVYFATFGLPDYGAKDELPHGAVHVTRM